MYHFNLYHIKSAILYRQCSLRITFNFCLQVLKITSLYYITIIEMAQNFIEKPQVRLQQPLKSYIMFYKAGTNITICTLNIVCTLHKLYQTSKCLYTTSLQTTHYKYLITCICLFGTYLTLLLYHEEGTFFDLKNSTDKNISRMNKNIGHETFIKIIINIQLFWQRRCQNLLTIVDR